MKRKITTRIEVIEDSGMPELSITTYLDLGVQKIKTSDILFIEEFCHKTGLSHILEPRKQYRDVWKTQRAIREMGGKNNA